MGDREILGRVVGPVDAVADVGDVGERLEAVQHAGRHVQMPERGIVEQEHLLLAERRRVRSGIDQDVVHGAVGAAHEFGFTLTAPAVHAADDPTHRTGLGILDERRRRAGHTAPLVEDLGVEGAGEQPAVVVVRLRDQGHHTCKPGRFYSHDDIVA